MKKGKIEKCIRCKIRKQHKEGFCKGCYAEIKFTLLQAEKDKIRIFGYPYSGMDNELSKKALEEIKIEDEFEQELKKSLEEDKK